MPIQLSKALLAIQGVLFITPLAIIFATLAPSVFLMGLFTASFSVVVLALLLGASLVSAGVVIHRFYRLGVSGLRTLSAWWWVSCAAGAAISVAGLVVLTQRTSTYVVSDDLDPVLRAAGLGAPLLVTYVHVLLEYLLRPPPHMLPNPSLRSSPSSTE